jgi:hypothetical protein
MTAMTEPACRPTTSGVPPDAPYGGRDPAHELYAHAAGVLAHAQALEAASESPETAPALTPTLACLETSLAALAQAVARLRVHAVEPFDGRRQVDVGAALERLSGVLDQGSFACTRAREVL